MSIPFTRQALLLTMSLASFTTQAGDTTWQHPGIVEGNLPAWYPQLAQQLAPSDSWLNGHYAQFSTWRAHARQLVRDALLTPDSHRPFAPEVLSRQQRDGYHAEKVALNITDDSRIAALVLTPDTAGPHPAIVLLHDHGSKFDIGKEKMIRPWGDAAKEASAKAWAEKFFTGRFVGDELAKRGYKVIAIDAPGWGDRGPMTYEQQQALASNFFNFGRSLAGEMAYEDLRTVDFLASQPDVDKAHIGVLGFSMGGYRAWQLAALSDKVAATAVISWFGTWQGLMTPGNNVLRGQSAFYMLHPGLNAKLDIPDIAAIAAPAPMLIFSGGKDKLFPASAVDAAWEKMHRIWQSQGGESHLLTRRWPDLGHVFYQEQQVVAFDWLDRWLQPGKTSPGVK